MGAGAQKTLAELVATRRVIPSKFETQTVPLDEALRIMVAQSGTLRADEDLPDAGTTPPLIPGGWFNYIPATHKTNNCDCQYCKPTAPKKEPFHNPFQEFFGDDKRLGASQYRDE